MKLLLLGLGLGITLLFLGVLLDQPQKLEAPLEEYPIQLESQGGLSMGAEPIPRKNALKDRIVAAFESREFKNALDYIQEDLSSSLADPSYRAWLERQLPIVYSSLGWQLVQDKRCDDALAIFEKSLSYGSSPFSLKGIGICSYRNQDYWQAELYLRKFMNDHGFEWDSLLILLDVLESLNQYAEAEQLLVASIKEPSLNESDRSLLNKKLSSMREKHKESLHQTNILGTYISMSYRAVEHDELGPWALQELDQTVDEFYMNFSIPRPLGYIEAVLYPIKSFKKLSHAPIWVSGLFDGRIRIPVPIKQRDVDYQKVRRILRHELTHALLTEAAAGGVLPTWFHEGLASFLECQPYCKGGYRAPSVNREGFLSMKTLESSFLSLPQLQVSKAYAQSYHLIQTIADIEGTEGIRTLIENIRPHTDQDSTSLLQPLGMSADEVFRVAARHWQGSGKL